MPISDLALDQVVDSWRQYAEERPLKISPSDLLKKRDLIMYRGLGLETPEQLARRLVEDRAVASMEMTMGHLYERLLEALGPRKLSSIEKRRPGNRGIDFIQQTDNELRVVNLKAGKTTVNADIVASATRNLIAARDHHLSAGGQRDDNPLRRQARRVVMVLALAKGRQAQSETSDGILVLTGDDMWAYFGAGNGLLPRLLAAMGRNPLDYDRYTQALQTVQERLMQLFRRERLVEQGGAIDWGRLIARFP